MSEYSYRFWVVPCWLSGCEEPPICPAYSSLPALHSWIHISTKKISALSIFRCSSNGSLRCSHCRYLALLAPGFMQSVSSSPLQSSLLCGGQRSTELHASTQQVVPDQKSCPWDCYWATLKRDAWHQCCSQEGRVGLWTLGHSPILDFWTVSAQMNQHIAKQFLGMTVRLRMAQGPCWHPAHS